MLIATETTTTRRATRPANRLPLAAGLALVVLFALLLWSQAGSTSAVVTGLLLNAAAAPLAHARQLHRRPDPLAAEAEQALLPAA